MDSELRQEVAETMGYVGGDGSDWYPEKTDKIMGLIARERQKAVEEYKKSQITIHSSSELDDLVNRLCERDISLNKATIKSEIEALIARESQKAVEYERGEIKKLWGNLKIQFGASAGSAIGATYTNDFDESFDFQLDRDAVKKLLDRLATNSNKREALGMDIEVKP